jgi:AraC-like DNA-binding protein
MKMQAIPATVQHHNGAERISSLFLELLERQFPIENPSQRVRLRSASDFAGQLAVHVNHLNRSLKEVARKTTSDIISERLLREAQALLKHTNWNVSEIAYCLGFEEPAHFNHFFKDRTRLSPSGFRNV